jgi:hypothetical protein
MTPHLSLCLDLVARLVHAAPPLGLDRYNEKRRGEAKRQKRGGMEELGEILTY